jgi:hypothetical protein
MSFCNNNIVAYSTESTIGFVDLYKYIQQLVNNKDVQADEKLAKFNLEVFQNMSDSQLRQKISSLKQLFEVRNKELVTKAEKLKQLQIINDEELPEAEKELEKINKILNNKTFSASIKMIQYKLRTNSQTEEDEIKYSFFKELEEQAAYLKNFKIGSLKKYVSAKTAAQKNFDNTKKVMNGLVRETIQKVEEQKINEEQKVELEAILSVWSERETRRIVMELNRDYDRSMNTKKINLKGTVSDALSKFLNIPIQKALVIMKDVDFRIKLFGNINMEDIQNKLNIINNELNEHEIIVDFFRMEEQRKYNESITKLSIKGVQRDPGFNLMDTSFDNIKSKATVGEIKKTIKKESLATKLSKSLKQSYSVLVSKNVLSVAEFKTVEQIIDNEIKIAKSTSNVTEIKAIIKVHIGRMIISKYLIEENVFSPAKTSSIILEKVYENEQQLVNTETLFNNIVNYENDAPFDVLRQSFNNMTQILKTFATVDVDTLYKKVDDLLNKDYGNQVGYSMNKKIPQKVITGARGELNIMNLIVLTSYTQDNNDFIADIIEKVLVDIETLNQTSNIWSWSAKSDSNKIINKIMNDEKYEFIDIVSQFAEEVDNSTTLTNEVTELVAAGKSVNVEELTKQFNAIYDMFLQMYKMDIVPHNLNKMRTKKSFDEVKREYFLGLLTGLYTTFIGKILEQSSSRRIKSFIIKNISVLGMYLNEEPKQIVVVQKEKEEKESNTSRTNKDDILNSFLTEDLDNIEYEEQEVVGLDDEESDDLMLELFGEE